MLISEYEFPNIKYEFPDVKRYLNINGKEYINDFKTTPNKPKKSETHPIKDIERVIINNPAVIILWKDGTKTIGKCERGDTFDKEKGLLVALAKHYFGNKQLRHFLEKYAWDEDKER